MESSLTEITVKTCDCYSAYFDDVVKLTIDDLKRSKFMDFEKSCYRLLNHTMIQCCFNCLKEKNFKMNITIVDDLLCSKSRDGENVKVAYSSCLGNFLRSDRKHFEKCCYHCQNLIIKNYF